MFFCFAAYSYAQCCPEFEKVGQRDQFLYEEDNIELDFYTDNNEDWLRYMGGDAAPQTWNYNKFIRVRAWSNRSENTDNYIQLYWWIGDGNNPNLTQTYANGVGPKAGIYDLTKPMVGLYKYYGYTYYWTHTDIPTDWPYLLAYRIHDFYKDYTGGVWVCPFSSYASTHGDLSNNNTQYVEGTTATSYITYFNSHQVTVGVADDGNIYIQIGGQECGKKPAVTIGRKTNQDVHKLTVTKEGNGTVTTKPDCENHKEGDKVTLTPTPDNASVCFKGWTGADAGSIIDNGNGTYSITMQSGDMEVNAVFGDCAKEVTDYVDTCSAVLPFIWRPWNNGGIVINDISQNGIQDEVKKGGINNNKEDSIVTLSLTLHEPRTVPVEVTDTFWQCEFDLGEGNFINIVVDDGSEEGIILDMENAIGTIYQTTDPDIYGCDSITIHEVIIIPETVQVVNTYCQNDFYLLNYDDVTDTTFISFEEDYYTLEGREYYQFEGEKIVYQDVTKSTQCPDIDSVTIITVKVFPSYRIPYNPGLCADELDEALANGDISFFGTTITDLSQDGMEFVTDGTVANMCDSVWYLDLTPIPNDTTYESMPVCSYPVTWKGKTYNSEDEFRTNPLITPTEGCNAYTILIPIETEPKEDVKDTVAICPHQLPYEWDGMTFTTAGTQTRDAENACDANVSHTLIVIDGVIQAGDTVCESLLPYTWEGETVTAADLTDNGAGFLTVTLEPKTLPSSLECDSTVQFTLTVIPEHTYDRVTICENDLPAFSWHVGDQDIPIHTETEAQNREVTLPSVLGCDSTVHLELTILPTKTEDLGTKYIKDTESFTVFAGTAFEQTYTSDCLDCQATGQTEAGCDSVVTFTVIVRNIETEEVYENVCENETPYIWNGIECTQTNEYTYQTKTIQGDLDSLVILHLTVNPVYYDMTDGKTVCQNELPYTWEGETFKANDAYTDLDDQTFYREVTKNIGTVAGCDSVVTFRLTVLRTYNLTDGATVCRNELPYLWKDKNGTVVETFDDAGSKQHSFQTVHGCDSVVTFTLTVAGVYDNIQDKMTICESRLPYEWKDRNGMVVETFDAAGSKTHTFQTVQGCDSTVTFTLTVISEIDPTVTEKTICESELPYTWGNITFQTAGTETQAFESYLGCDSVVTLTLHVDPSYYNITDGETVCPDALPYRWQDVTFTGSGTQTRTLQTINGCDSVVTFTLTVQTPTTDVKTDKVCDNQLPYTWNPTPGYTQDINADGTYSYTLKSSIGCDSIHYTLNLSIDRDYVAAQPAIATSEICANDDALRIALNATTGEPAAYDIIFENKALAQGLENISHETVPDDHLIIVPMPVNEDSTKYVRPDDYVLTLTVYDGCDRKTDYQLPFKVLYPSWLIQQRWRDVLALYNDKYNGGYTFSVIRWFLNNTEITGQGAHNSYIQMSPVLEMGVYYTMLTRTDDGKTFRTCDFTPNLASLYYAPEKGKIHLVQQIDPRHIAVRTNLSGAYRVYDVTGKEIMSGLFGEEYGNPEIVFSAACADGAYIIRFEANDGTEDTKKWLIR